MPPIVVTGAAGFIGMHVADRLLRAGADVVGVDSMTTYYDINLKRARLRELTGRPGFRFECVDLSNRPACAALFDAVRPEGVVHLAAQPGVRYSVERPDIYIDANLVGFGNVLEGSRHAGVGHLVYASSSSVYGDTDAVPFSTADRADRPLSLYAATKRANELMAHAYAHLFGFRATGLRLFTVYGPWGRPDMAVFSFAKAIFEGRPIDLYHGGELWRDFTYIDDVVDAILALIRPEQPGAKAPSGAEERHCVFNVGNHTPVRVTELIELLEEATGRQAHRRVVGMQAGDVLRTHADVSALEAAVGFAPRTTLAEGVRRFVSWYRQFYGVDS